MIESVLGKSVAANLSTGGTVDGDLTVTGSLGVGGDASINLTSVVSNSTIIDATGTEAFLVRANSDGGDTLIVDTTNSRVGINKTPTNVLNIFRDDSSTVGTNDVVIENDGSGDASLKFSLTGATDWFAYVDNSDSDKFKIRRSTSDFLIITETGSVGLGATPTNNLHIEADSGDEGITIHSAGDTGNAITIDANRSSADAGIGTMLGKWNGTLIGYMGFFSGSDTSNKDDGVLKFATTPSGGSATVALTIGTDQSATFAGDILVNNSTPALTLQDSDGSNQSLEILHSGANTFFTSRNDSSNGAFFFRGYNGSSYSTALAIDSSQSVTISSSVNGNPVTSGTTQTNLALRVKGSATNVLDIGQQSASPYGVWMQVCDSTSLGTEYPLLLNPNGGDVGINEVSPDKKLHITSSTSTDGIMVEQSGVGSALISFKADNTNRGFIGVDDSNGGAILSSTSGSDYIMCLRSEQEMHFGTNGNNVALKLDTSQNATFAGNVTIPAGNLLYLDGGTDTYIYQETDNKISFATNSGVRLSIDNSSSTFSNIVNVSGAGLKITGQNLAHVASSMTLGHEGSSKSQIRVYGADGTTEGSLEIVTSASDGTPSTTVMLLDANSVISLSNNDGGNTGNTIFGHTAWQQTANVGADYNTIFGQEAMGSGNIGAAERNTGIGFAVMRSITTGDSNVGAGADALYSITTGSDNIGIGRGSGDALKTGEKNCLIGRNALGSGAFGETGNVAIGHESMANLNEGSIGTADNNIAIGQQSLLGGAFAGNPITVSDCIAIGAFALDATADNPHTGTIAIGRSALGALTSGGSNTAIGYESQLYQTDGSNNVSLGFKALRNADNGESFNTVLGTKACEFVNHASSDGNTIVGMQAMVGGTGARSYNVALGFRAMGSSNTQNNVGGNENVFIGAYSGNGTWTTAGCDLNTAVGYQSMEGALNGATLNTAVGSTALKSLTEGDSNVAVGASALESNTTARYNTSVGASALQYNTNGEHNVALGLSAGRTDVSGSNATSPDQSIAIGSGSQFSSTTPTNEIVIGYNADGGGDNTVTLGNTSVTAVYMAQDSGALVHCAGIQFPASQAASSGANVLDDYEEGTYTATVTPATSGSINVNSDYDQLSYVKIGSMVTVNGAIAVSGVSSPVGYFTVNLPFAIGDKTELAGRFSGSVTVYGTSGLDVSRFVVLGIEGESGFRVYAGDATSLVSDSANAIIASTTIAVGISYFV